MLLARAAARQKEIALRSALGATRWDTLRQLLIESLTLALIGGGAGLLLAMWGVRVLLSLGPTEIPRLETIGVDSKVLLFSLLASLCTGLLFGLAPAWMSTSVNLTDALKRGERGSGEGPRRNRMERPVRVEAQVVSWDLLPALGIQPELGRGFVADEEKVGTRVAVISHALWASQFASDKSVIGRAIRLSGDLYTVIGVMCRLCFPGQCRRTGMLISA